MNFVIIDLEWNGAFSKRVHGYFNEIIEIGAIKLDENLREMDRFQAIIHPVISKKLTSLVTSLTSITDEDLTDGGTFTGAMSALRKWIGKTETVVLTWSTTDLLVLLENYRYFCKTETIPFLTAYLDLQAYYQQRQNLPLFQQVALSKACEQLGINEEDVAHHRALDDSILTGRILTRIYDKPSFSRAVSPANAEFYRRITFKNTYITNADHPLVKPEYLVFTCPFCHAPLRVDGHWHGHNRALCASAVCDVCDKTFTARVQIKQKFDAVEVKRKLVEKQKITPAGEEKENVYG